MKKALSVFLVAILCFVIVPTAHAEETQSYFYTYTSVTGVKADTSAHNTKADSTTLTYKKINRENFDDYIAILSKMNFVPFTLKSSDGKSEYYAAYNSYIDTAAMVIYNAEQQLLSIKIYGDTYELPYKFATEQIAKVDSFKISNTGDAQGYVLPQFYAIGGDTPTWQGQTASDYVFDGKMCWEERYDDISLKTIDNYLFTMYLFGCDIKGELISLDSSASYGRVEIINLIQNDETLVRLTYFMDSGNVIVNYNPAPSKPYDLKSGEELVSMIQVPK